MDVPISYMFAHPEYYEPLDRVEGGRDYKELAEAGMPAGWEIHRSGLWYQASHPACEMPEQGFKIHVSSKPSTAADLLMRVVPICCGAMTSFKFVANDTLLRFTVSKRWARGASGKFITIYPRSQAIFHELLDRLQAETGELQGPYVLLDKRYGDRGVLYYRYGGFRAVRRLNPDGTTIPEIRTPSGSLMEDYRLPEFRLPNWVRDPCADESEAQSDGPVVLADRFEVESAIQFSPAASIGLTIVVLECQ